MRLTTRWVLSAAISIGLAGLAVTASAQTSTTSKEVKHFEVVSVDGNKVIVKGAEGAKEITVPDDFQMTVDGKPVTVRDLKPGMKGTATITTTTTTTPVHVTEVKNGEVMQASGSSIIVRTPTGIKMFNEGDVAKRNVQIIKDGKPVSLSDLHTGDRLSATIVTEGTPKVMTQRQVQAALTGAPAPAATTGSRTPAPAAAAPPAAPAAAPAAPAAAPAKKLPKTGSSLPLIGVLGALSLAIGLSLTIARRRRSF
jgi:LPXTG-motif cell wall-anchored protein